jgi:hypothetical protein
LILGTSQGQSNIRLGNSRAKFLCVAKMLIYINNEHGRTHAAAINKRGQAGKIAVFSALAAAPAAVR